MESLIRESIKAIKAAKYHYTGVKRAFSDGAGT